MKTRTARLVSVLSAFGLFLFVVTLPAAQNLGTPSPSLASADGKAPGAPASPPAPADGKEQEQEQEQDGALAREKEKEPEESEVPEQSPNEKAARYHAALLKRPGGGYLFERFFNAWMVTGTVEGLGTFLSSRATADEATTADRLLHGHFLVQTGRESEALAVFARLLEDDPGHPEARAEAAKAHARNLDFAKAVEHIAEAIPLTDDPARRIEYRKLRGRWLARADRTEEALAAWKQLAGDHPDDEDLREDLVDLYLDEHLPEEALAAQEALVESTRDPHRRITRRMRLGDIHLRAGQRSEALALYSECLSGTGRGTWLEKEILAQIEQLFRREDDLAGLAKHYTALAESEPGRIAARIRLAEVRAEQGDSEAAIETFRAVLRATPGERAVRESFLELLSRLGEHQEAAAQAAALAQAHPEDPELVAGLALRQHAAGQTDEAEQSVQRYLELAGRSEPAHLRAARMLEQFERTEAAADVFARLVERFPDSVGAKDERAAFLHRSGETGKAVALWQKIAAEGDSEDALRAARMLSSRGERESAHALLAERVEESATDFVFLGRYIDEALAAGRSASPKAGQDPDPDTAPDSDTDPTPAEAALPWGLKRLALAESPGDLADALRQVRALLRETGTIDRQREELRQRQTDLALPESCLLSGLLEDHGEHEAAEAVLRPWLEQGEPLAHDQRIRQLESRQLWAEAAAVLEQLAASSGTPPADRLERLVQLHLRVPDDESTEAALRWTAEWKKMAPGSPRPWLTEAGIHTREGELDTATEVLRRAAARFPDEVEVRTRLASLYQQQGKRADAERITWTLYEESEDLGEKLRWAGSLAGLAIQSGDTGRLLEQFEERRRANRESIVPLLAIAEIHRRDNHYEARREALLEATRLRPEDLGLLHQIARISEAEGQWEQAAATLEEALPLDKTDGTARRLALLHLRYGDEDEAHRRFAELAGGDEMDADTVLGLADAMIARADWERAVKFLDEHRGRFPDDYRLAYLRAIALEENYQEEAAIEAFLALLDYDQELADQAGKKPSVTPAATVTTSSMDRYGERGLPPGTEELGERFNKLRSRMSAGRAAYYYRQQLQHGYRQFTSISTALSLPSGLTASSHGGMVRLPPSLEQMQTYAIAHLAEISNSFDPEGEELAALAEVMESKGIDHASLLLRQSYLPNVSYNQADLVDLIADPSDDSAAAFAFRVVNQSYAQLADGKPGDEAETLLADSERHFAEYPDLRFFLALRLLPSGQEKVQEAARKFLADAPPGELPPASIVSMGQVLLHNHLDDLPDDLQGLLFDRWAGWIELQREERIENNPGQSLALRFPGHDPVAVILHQTGEIRDLLAYLEKQNAAYQEALANEPGVQQPSTRHPAANYGGFSPWLSTSGNQLVAPLDFPEISTPGVAPFILRSFRNGIQIPGRNMPAPLDPGKAGEAAAELRDPILAALVFAAIDEREQAAAKVEEFLARARKEAGKEDAPLPLREAILAAGWYQRNEQWEKAAGILESLQRAPLPVALRKRIDSALLHGARESATSSDPDETVVQSGVTAALRLRYGLRSSRDRETLAAAMTDLGMEEEAEKLTTLAKAKTAAASSYSVPSRPVSIAPGVQDLAERIDQYVKDGKTERAREDLRRALSRAATSRANSPESQWDYQMINLVNNLGRKHDSLLREVIESLKPGDEGEPTPKQLLEYAHLLHLAGDHEGASARFRSALDGLGGSQRRRNLPVIAMIAGMHDPGAGAELLAEADIRSYANLHQYHENAMRPLSYRSGDGRTEIRHNLARMAAQWTEALPADTLPRTDLSWLERIRHELGGHYDNLPSLYSSELDRLFESSGYDEDLFRERREIHDLLCRAMIRAPQTARRGFAALASLRIAENPEEAFTDPDLHALAREALETIAEQRTTMPLNSYGSSHRLHQEKAPLWYPGEYLLWNARLAGGGPGRLDEILVPLEKLWDRKLLRDEENFRKLALGKKGDFPGALRAILDPNVRVNSWSSRDIHISREQASTVAKALAVWRERKDELAPGFSLTDFFREEVRGNSSGTNAQFALLAARIVLDKAGEEGWSAAEPLVEEFVEAWLGEREQWDQFRRIPDPGGGSSSSAGQPGAFRSPLHVECAAFLRALCSSPDSAFQCMAFLREQDLDADLQLEHDTLLNRIRYSQVKNSPGLVRRIYFSAPFVADADHFHPGPTDLDDELPMVRLLDYVKSWKKADQEDFKKELRELGTFGAELGLAWFQRKEAPDTFLAPLAGRLDALRSAPGHQREGYTRLVAAAFPEGIPREGLSPESEALAEFLGAEREKSAREKAEALLEIDKLKDNGFTSTSSLHKALEPALEPLLQAGEYQLLSEIYWHLAGLAEKEQKAGGWGSYSSSWNLHGHLVRRLINYTSGGGIERIAWNERLLREDEDGRIPMARFSEFPTILLRGFRDRGGPDKFDEANSGLFDDLWNACGEGADPATLAFLCDQFPLKFSHEEKIRLLEWADRAADSEAEWASFAESLAIFWRRTLASYTPESFDSLRPGIPEPDAWQPVLRELITDESRPLSWRLGIAGPAARVPAERNDPGLVRTSARVLAEALAADAPFDDWRYSEVAAAFNRLPVDEEWKEIALLLHEGWVAKIRNNHRDRSTGLAWHPTTRVTQHALHTHAKLGDRDKLNRVRKDPHVQSKNLNDARPIFCLVEHGFLDEAKEEFLRSLEWVDFPTNYSLGRFDYKAVYSNEVHKQLPGFLAGFDDEGLRYFAELVVSGAPEGSLVIREKNPEFPGRGARLTKLAQRLWDTDFTGHEALRKRSLRQLAPYTGPMRRLRGLYAKANDEIDIARMIARQNRKFLQYDLRISAAHAYHRLSEGDIKPARQFVAALKRTSDTNSYYRREAHRFYLQRFATCVRGLAQYMEPEEVQAAADSMRILLAAPSIEELSHSELPQAIVAKIAADIFADRHQEVQTQLESPHFSKGRLKLLQGKLKGKADQFWIQMSHSLRVKSNNPDVRPDDETRRDLVRRVLEHLLAAEVLKAEKDPWKKMEDHKWVEPGEKDSEWGEIIQILLEELSEGTRRPGLAMVR